MALQSIDLWLDYLNFVRGHDKSPCHHSKMRGLFERALKAGGLHVSEGSKLWAAFICYEMEYFNSIPNDNVNEKERQVEFIRSLFHRELYVPLSNMEMTFGAYKLWEANNAKPEYIDFSKYRDACKM